MKRTLEQQSRDLNERRRQFEDDKRLFEKEYHEWMEKMESQSVPAQDPKGLVIYYQNNDYHCHYTQG